MGTDMRFRMLPGTDLNVSEVCLGTMTWGEQNTEAQAHEQLDQHESNQQAESVNGEQ